VIWGGGKGACLLFHERSFFVPKNNGFILKFKLFKKLSIQLKIIKT